MTKRIYVSLLSICALCMVFSFNSCKSDDDDNSTEEWKAYNDNIFNEVTKNPAYKAQISYSGNGSVYWKTADNIKSGISTRINEVRNPTFNDSVVCRYKGWYLDYEGKKVIFDSTEDDYNKQGGVGFRVNKVIDGWATMLQIMKVGDEREFCVPYTLGYGSTGSGSTIPAYTTLWFDMKLLKIIPINPNEYN